MGDTDKLNKILKTYNDLFTQGFHNLLWQIMINERHKGKKIAFTAAYTDIGLELVLAMPDGGYIPCSCAFNDTITYMKGNDYAEDISMAVFDIDKKEVLDRITKSYQHSGKIDSF